VRLGWRLLAFVLLAGLLAFPASLIPFPEASMTAGSFGPLVGCLLAGWILLRLDGRGPGALGFFLGRSAITGSLGGLAVGVFVTLLAIAFIAGMGGVRWTVDAGSPTQYAWGAVGALWIFAIPAALEEALLRGYPLQALAESFGRAPALWLTAIVFAVLHLGNPNVSVMGIGNIVVAGLFLGVIYLKTASLWWATGAHLGWNWSEAYLADLPVSGIEGIDAPFLEPVLSGSTWISGGSFGPEASLVTTGVVGLASILLWKSEWLRPSDEAVRNRPLILFHEVEGEPELEEFGGYA
jgi:membrane protease YdiL (CAAX protease family)